MRRSKPWREATEEDGEDAWIANCWIWKGHTDREGTPQVRTKHSTTTGARWIWQRHRSPLRQGQVLHRNCGKHLCVNPAHHSAVSRAEVAYRKGMTKLTEREAYWAWRSLKAGMTHREVASHFGISPRTVLDISRGEYATMRKTDNAAK